MKTAYAAQAIDDNPSPREKIMSKKTEKETIKRKAGSICLN